jgi:hypothetical protein
MVFVEGRKWRCSQLRMQQKSFITDFGSKGTKNFILKPYSIILLPAQRLLFCQNYISKKALFYQYSKFYF